jgi:hypothetical protein
MNNFKLLQNIILAPQESFGALKDKPKSSFPLMLMLVVSTAVIFHYFSVVDFDWLMAELASRTDEPVDPTAQEVMTSGIVLSLAMVTNALGIIAFRFFEGIYYLLAGKMANINLSFQHWFALTCWASLPGVMVFVVSEALLVLNPSSQTMVEQLNALSLNELFFQVAPSDPMFTLLTTLTVLHPWMWAIYAIGIKTWTDKSMTFCATFAVAPWLVFYGIWFASNL